MAEKPNWTQRLCWDVPEGPSAFEIEADRLKLNPADYAASEELKEWVRKYKDQKYVPLDLLRIWRFKVRAEI